MSEDDKITEATLSASPNVDGPLPDCFWVTRDMTNGRLVDVVEVWYVRPVARHFDDGDVMWLSPTELVDVQDTWYATWSLAEARHQAMTVPDTERECVRIGREPITPTVCS